MPLLERQVMNRQLVTGREADGNSSLLFCHLLSKGVRTINSPIERVQILEASGHKPAKRAEYEASSRDRRQWQPQLG